MTYEEQLKDPRWIYVRFRVVQRDNYICKRCDRQSMEIHVHHTYYRDGYMAWEYPYSSLICLCPKCHAEVHGISHPDRIPHLFQQIGDSVNSLVGLALKAAENGKKIY